MKRHTTASIRGLRDIRTRPVQVYRARVPYLAYMTISCLEMEKVRREKEKQSASCRIRNIEARMVEIEKEKSALLTALGLGERPAGSPTQPAITSKEGPRGPAREKKPFRIRY